MRSLNTFLATMAALLIQSVQSSNCTSPKCLNEKWINELNYTSDALGGANVWDTLLAQGLVGSFDGGFFSRGLNGLVILKAFSQNFGGECESEVFGFNGEYTEQICAFEEVVIKMCENEDIDCGTFSTSKIASVKATLYQDKALAMELICRISTDFPADENFINACKNYTQNEVYYTSTFEDVNGLIQYFAPDAYQNKFLNSQTFYNGVGDREEGLGLTIPKNIVSLRDSEFFSLEQRHEDMAVPLKVLVIEFLSFVIQEELPDDVKRAIGFTEISGVALSGLDVAMSAYILQKYSSILLTDEETKNVYSYYEKETVSDPVTNECLMLVGIYGYLEGMSLLELIITVLDDNIDCSDYSSKTSLVKEAILNRSLPFNSDTSDSEDSGDGGEHSAKKGKKKGKKGKKSFVADEAGNFLD